jgi:hypothetical protein
MQADGFGDRGTEQGGQEVVAALFVLVVDAGFGGVVAEVMHQVANVVQQAGGDQCIRTAGFLGEPGGLQGVLTLVDRAEAIGAVGLQGQQVGDMVQSVVGHRGILPVP